MLAFSYFGYFQLVDEQLVGQIKFTQSQPESYVARLMLEGEDRDRMYQILGDEWQIDARVVTWEPPMTLLGLDPIFQLDRLSGRYSEVEEELSKHRSVHALSEPVPLDVVVVLKEPVLEGDNLVYKVEVLDGPESGEGEANALFIDVIGMPRGEVREEVREEVRQEGRQEVRQTARRVDRRL